MRAFVLSLLLATAAIAPAAAQMVAPPKPARVAENFLPHRATYDLKLKSARWASAVSGLSGRMVSEFDDVCAGYTFNQRLVTDFTDSEGTATSGNFWVSTYESADGSDYRFTLNNAINGISVITVLIDTRRITAIFHDLQISFADVASHVVPVKT